MSGLHLINYLGIGVQETDRKVGKGRSVNLIRRLDRDIEKPLT